MRGLNTTRHIAGHGIRKPANEQAQKEGKHQQVLSKEERQSKNQPEWNQRSPDSSVYSAWNYFWNTDEMINPQLELSIASKDWLHKIEKIEFIRVLALIIHYDSSATLFSQHIFTFNASDRYHHLKTTSMLTQQSVDKDCPSDLWMLQTMSCFSKLQQSLQ